MKHIYFYNGKLKVKEDEHVNMTIEENIIINRLIQDKMREMAINELIKEGVIDVNN